MAHPRGVASAQVENFFAHWLTGVLFNGHKRNLPPPLQLEWEPVPAEACESEAPDPDARRLPVPLWSVFPSERRFKPSGKTDVLLISISLVRRLK